MSTISSLTSSVQMQRPDPRTQMDQTISAAVQAGVLSQTDATAIEGALDKIDTSLSGSGQQQALDPSQMKARIDGLIDQQVKDGSLTQDQADELKAFFAAGPGGEGSTDTAGSSTASSTSAASGTGGARGAGGPGGGGGAAATDTTTDTDGDGIPDYIDSQPTVYNADSSASTDGTSTSSDSSSDTASTSSTDSDSKLEALKQFLENLRNDKAGPGHRGQGSDTYAINGQSSGSATSGLIVNQYA